MNILQGDKSPNYGENLAAYVKRIRLFLGLNQRELATIAAIHLQSLGKIERGLTAKLSSHSKAGLASALQVPVEYLGLAEKAIRWQVQGKEKKQTS